MDLARQSWAREKAGGKSNSGLRDVSVAEN